MSSQALLEKIGPYRIEARLGAGGMGEVYRAYDERLRRRVALKQIRPERSARPGARERFLREARTVAGLNHPALIHLHDIVETDDGDWIVMELVEGPPLARLLEAGPLDPAVVLALGQEVAGGLAAAHAAGILHRDLKAENVVVTRDGRAKVLDFGLAAQVDTTSELLDEDTLADLTGEGRIVGTPRAMAPEQIRGQEVDQRSDLFSLGVLLYEMSTGRSPFLGPEPAETLAQVCHEEQEPIYELSPDVPRELSDLIDRLLAKEPADRPADADEVVEALARIARETRREEPAAPDPVVSTPAAVQEEEREPFHLRGERRQITLLCCELTGTSLDPEVLFEVLPPFQAVVNEAIERYEGHLYDVQGHRFAATFGYPRSHEDNARRAVMTALRIAARTAPAAQGVQARVGAHTGPAVILHRETGEHLALGETLDLATALQEQAMPGDVLVSGLTRRLVAGFCEEEPVEAVSFPPRSSQGAGAGAGAFRMVTARDVHNRVEASRGLTPFVGREHELALLAGRFELAREGVGQTVLVTGDAGLGKSRLLRELRNRLAPADSRWIAAYGSPYARNLPLHPLGSLLRRLLKIDEKASDTEQLARLEESLEENDCPAAKTLPLFTTLLGLPGGELDLSRLRREMLEAVPSLFQQAAEHQPLVVACEDLHQVDPTTLELIGRLIDVAASSPMLLVLTCRPEFHPPWGHRAQLTQLRLEPLDHSAAGTLIDALAAGGELSAELRERIAERADGIPLFVEELVREMPAADEPVPATLRDLLAVRLDRLGAAREIARIVAGLGREVDRGDLATATGLDEAALGQELDRLRAAGVLVHEGTLCRFPSTLLWEATAASLLEEDRRMLLLVPADKI